MSKQWHLKMISIQQFISFQFFFILFFLNRLLKKLKESTSTKSVRTAELHAATTRLGWLRESVYESKYAKHFTESRQNENKSQIEYASESLQSDYWQYSWKSGWTKNRQKFTFIQLSNIKKKFLLNKSYINRPLIKLDFCCFIFKKNYFKFKKSCQD